MRKNKICPSWSKKTSLQRKNKLVTTAVSADGLVAGHQVIPRRFPEDCGGLSCISTSRLLREDMVKCTLKKQKKSEEGNYWESQQMERNTKKIHRPLTVRNKVDQIALNFSRVMGAFGERFLD